MLPARRLLTIVRALIRPFAFFSLASSRRPPPVGLLPSASSRRPPPVGFLPSLNYSILAAHPSSLLLILLHSHLTPSPHELKPGLHLRYESPVRANLLTDANTLLESAITRNPNPDSSKNLIAQTLLTTYESAAPDPQVFDLLVQVLLKMRFLQQAFDSCCCFGDHMIILSLCSFN